MTVRSAKVTDIPAIQQIAMEAWQAAYGHMHSPEFMVHELDREYSEIALMQQMQEWSHRFLLVEGNGGVVVGFASYSVPIDSEEGIGKLHKIYLQPDLKGKGYGSLLIRTVIDACRSQAGCQQIQLRVNRANPAVDFYRRYGFSIVREEDHTVGPGFVRYDYVMVKAL